MIVDDKQNKHGEPRESQQKAKSIHFETNNSIF